MAGEAGREGTATVRRLHTDALRRLREFNEFVVNRTEARPSVESLVLTTRLAMIRAVSTNGRTP